MTPGKRPASNIPSIQRMTEIHRQPILVFQPYRLGSGWSTSLTDESTVIVYQTLYCLQVQHSASYHWCVSTPTIMIPQPNMRKDNQSDGLSFLSTMFDGT